MAKFPIVVVKEKGSTVGAEQASPGILSIRVTWYDQSREEFQHLVLDTHLRGVLQDMALVQGVDVRAVDGAYQIELGEEDIPSEYDLSTKR